MGRNGVVSAIFVGRVIARAFHFISHVTGNAMLTGAKDSLEKAHNWTSRSCVQIISEAYVRVSE